MLARATVQRQNVDGLHTHSSLDITRDVVVECHGSLRDLTENSFGLQDFCEKLRRQVP